MSKGHSYKKLKKEKKWYFLLHNSLKKDNLIKKWKKKKNDFEDLFKIDISIKQLVLQSYTK